MGHRHHRRRPLPAWVGVVFADLCGFTALTESVGDDAAAELANRFHALAWWSLAPGARLVKTLGDGVLIVAPDAEAALCTARRLRDRVAADRMLPPVHAGLAAGPVVWRRHDVFGATVNAAARLAAAATPWEIRRSPDASSPTVLSRVQRVAGSSPGPKRA
jgi:adenylate cyclase